MMKDKVLLPVKFLERFLKLHDKITSSAVTDTLNQGLKEVGKSMGGAGEGAKEQAGAVKEKNQRVIR